MSHDQGLVLSSDTNGIKEVTSVGEPGLYFVPSVTAKKSRPLISRGQ